MLAILRPEPAGTQDVNTLSAMGIPAMSLPMLEIAPCLPADIATQIVQADHLVFTSPAAIAAIMARDGLESVVAGKACFCVGTATAQAAKQAGLTPVDSSAGNAGALAEDIIADMRRNNAQTDAPCLLWLSAETVARDLVAMLAAHNIRLVRQVVYAANPVAGLSDDAQRLIASHQINAVLALSARTLKIFQQLLTRYGLWHHHRQMHLIAASEQIIGSVTSEFASTELVNPAASGGYLEQLAGIIDSLPDS